MSESPDELPQHVLDAVAVVQVSPELKIFGDDLIAKYRADDPAEDPRVVFFKTMLNGITEASNFILRLLREVDRLNALVPNTAAANASRRFAAREMANLVRVLAGQGLTNAQIAERVDRSVRHVQRLKNG